MLFNNRAGNAGTGKGFLVNLGAKREAVKGLQIASQQHAYNNAYNNNAGNFEHDHTGPFSGPSTQEHLQDAHAAAKKAGVSDRKIAKAIGKASEIGNKYGSEHAAFGATGKNPFRG